MMELNKPANAPLNDRANTSNTFQTALETMVSETNPTSATDTRKLIARGIRNVTRKTKS